MLRGEINEWFARYVWSSTLDLKAFDLKNLARLELETDEVHEALIRAELAMATSTRRGTIAVAGHAATFGGLITLFGPLAWVGTSLAIAGAAIAAVNLVLGRMDALERSWIAARLVDLNRFADRLEQEIARR